MKLPTHASTSLLTDPPRPTVTTEPCAPQDATYRFCWGCCDFFFDEPRLVVDIDVPGVGSATAHDDATCIRRALDALRGPRSAVVARRLLITEEGDRDGFGRVLVYRGRHHVEGNGPLRWFFIVRDRGVLALVDEDGRELAHAGGMMDAAWMVKRAFPGMERDSLMVALLSRPAAVGA